MFNNFIIVWSCNHQFLCISVLGRAKQFLKTAKELDTTNSNDEPTTSENTETTEVSSTTQDEKMSVEMNLLLYEQSNEDDKSENGKDNLDDSSDCGSYEIPNANGLLSESDESELSKDSIDSEEDSSDCESVK